MVERTLGRRIAAVVQRTGARLYQQGVLHDRFLVPDMATRSSRHRTQSNSTKVSTSAHPCYCLICTFVNRTQRPSWAVALGHVSIQQGHRGRIVMIPLVYS